MAIIEQKLSVAGQIVALPRTGVIAPGELCARLGVSKQAVSKWRAKHGFPSAIGSGARRVLDANAVAEFLIRHDACIVRY